MTATTDIAHEPRVTGRTRPRAARMLAAAFACEVRANLRVPEFMVGAVSVPILLYLMFGATEAGDVLPAGTPVAAMMAVSLSGYGIVSLAIFTFGIDVANERGKGWLRTRRVTPLPMWVHLAAKVGMGVVFSALVLAGITTCAILLGDVRLPLVTWARTWAVLLSGAVAFSTMGFALAWLVRPRAAAALGNLLFLPLSFASGFFFPLGELPPFLARVAPWMPTHHYGRLAWAQVGTPADVAGWTGSSLASSSWASVASVVGSFVVFGILARVGWRRERADDRE